MRKQIVAGNWKMNKDYVDSELLVSKLLEQYSHSQTEVIIAPPFTSLLCSSNLLKGSQINVAAQNMHFAENGAYTGEISAGMLKSIGIQTVILGHSERRAYFNETDTLLAKKVDTALQHSMRIIFCFGEELADRKSGNEEVIVEGQIKNALFHLPASAWENIVLAYEPVWAIGTGETASPEQAQDMHAFVRKTIENKYSSDLSSEVTIIYGGSVKSTNAKEIFSKVDVDGGLIGGAALDVTQFNAIINAF
jgi:triosephosphate isomerase